MNNSVLFFFICFLGWRIPGYSEQNPPNIIIILADDAGYADFGFMGSPDLLTPSIDRITENGVYFTDAHTSASVCSPSRAGLLTGRYQQRFGHENNIPPPGLGLDTGEVTLASVLQSAGYRTALFGKWHLGETGPYHPNRRGFDEFYGFLGGHRAYFANAHDDDPSRNTAVQHNGKYQTFDGYFTDILGAKATQFVEENQKQSFFILLSFNAVHTPMQATVEDMNRFEGHPRQKLAAMTWAMDRAVGKVLDQLDAMGLTEQTLVFFLSDNGGAATNQSSTQPLKGFKGTEFEGGHRVPFALQWKGTIKPQQAFRGLTSALDIFPTATFVAGIKDDSNKPTDGVNLIPFLTEEKSGSPHQQLFWRIGPWSAARYDAYKVVSAAGVGQQLYNLDQDIGETTDLQHAEDQVFNKIQGQYKAWEQETIPPLWKGSPQWTEVKKVIYQDLFENRVPTVSTPSDLKVKTQQ